MNSVTEIDMLKFRGNNSTVYTGRPQGEAARKELKLDEFDTGAGNVRFIIPKNTTTITPSFFLGLIFDSIKKLGIETYRKKYTFVFEDFGDDMKKILESDIAEGERNAINSLTAKGGLGRFLKTPI